MNGGAVDFHRLSDDQTRMTLTLDYDPQGFLESVGDALGFMDRRGWRPKRFNSSSSRVAPRPADGVARSKIALTRRCSAAHSGAS